MSDQTTQHARTLRKNQTDAEKLLWSRLRNRQFENLKFRRQHPIPPYILDFFCEEKMFAVELDGGQHNEKKDKERSQFLEKKGIKITRYWNNDVLRNIDGVLENLKNELITTSQTSSPSPHPSPKGEGEERICIAKIGPAHGIKGLVKLHVFVEDLELLNNPLFTSDVTNKTLTLSLKNATNKFWIAEIEGITDRTHAETLRGTELYIERAALPEADEDEFYIDDLIGLDVEENQTKIGKIISVENFGASDLIEIQPLDGSESFYLPFVDENIIEITDKSVVVEIPEGLRD
ncbi:MAG: ribosome maturation factor RimM [Alphaproteobacteria bacterium]|nr:ribosome maturation factor RimM [Alphaproteobacteria bacterium]